MNQPQKGILEFQEAEREKTAERPARRRKIASVTLGTADTPFVDYCLAYIESKKLLRMFFADTKLYDISYLELEAFNDYMQNVRNAKNSTIAGYFDVIRPDLQYAFKVDKIIPDNPYDDVEPVVKERPMTSYYNKDELDLFFETIKGHKFELHYKMLASYGFRRSELVGLRWSSIDFDHDMIKVNHKVLMINKELIPHDKLKTKSSYRTLPLLSYIKKELQYLKQEIEENKKFYGDSYNNEWSDYVFVNEVGSLVTPDNLTSNFRKTLKSKNLKHLRLHDLRHSCASLLLASGEINLKQIQEWLGHADFTTTANIYSHLDYGSKKQMADVLNKTFGNKIDCIETAQASEPDELFQHLLSHMKILGFDDINKYMNFVREHLDEKLDKENGFEM